MEVVRRVVS